MSWWQDLKYTARTLKQSPGFTVVVVVTLALGIGANVGVFSIVHAALLRSLPFPQAERLVRIYESRSPNDLSASAQVAPANFLDWREQSRVFTELAATCGFHYNLTGAGAPEHLSGAAVSASLFAVMGVQPVLGRAFRSEEDRADAPRVVILSHGLWHRRWHGDPSIVGRAISLNGDPYVVVGVMPAGWSYPEARMDVWVPLQRQILPERMRWRDSRFLNVVGRLRSGSTLDSARADLNRISVGIKQSNADADVYGGVAVLPLHESLTRDLRPKLLLSFGIVGLVLLIACANVANLMLVRIAGRRRDWAIRMALGAKASRLLRQLLMEGLLLGVMGGMFGVLVILGGKNFLLAFVPSVQEELQLVRFSPAVLAFGFVLSLLTGMGLGTIPALAMLRADLQDVLRQAGRTATEGRTGRRLRHTLAAAEICISVILLTGTGLLFRSLLALEHVPLGFRTNHLLAARVALPRIKYQRDVDVVAFFDRVVERVRALPGVEEAAMVNRIPLDDGGFTASFTISGRQPLAGEYSTALLRLADARYFAAMAIPVLAGRSFTGQDGTNSAPVAIVNQTMARRYWPGRNPLGEFVTLVRNDVNGQLRPHRIVGIVGDVRERINSEPEPAVFLPYAQMSFPTMYVIFRTRAAPGAMLAPVQQAIQAVDVNQPVSAVFALDDVVSDSLGGWRSGLYLMGTLATWALVLAVVGLFAVMSHLVGERTREFGVRMAVGARPTDILMMVLGNSASLTAAGVVGGLLAASALTRFLSSLVYGIHPNDPASFAAVAVVVGLLALAGSYVPARRAARVDPLTALRDE